MVLVVVYRLSKYAHFIGLKHRFTAYSVAVFFVQEIVRLHGFPSSKVSDRDKIFMSNFLVRIVPLTRHHIATEYDLSPRTDGQSEIFNQALKTYLCFFING